MAMAKIAGIPLPLELFAFLPVFSPPEQRQTNFPLRPETNIMESRKEGRKIGASTNRTNRNGPIGWWWMGLYVVGFRSYKENITYSSRIKCCCIEISTGRSRPFYNLNHLFDSMCTHSIYSSGHIYSYSGGTVFQLWISLSNISPTKRPSFT